MEESQSEDGRVSTTMTAAHPGAGTACVVLYHRNMNTGPVIVFLPWARREACRGRLYRSLSIEWPSRYAVPPQRPTDEPCPRRQQHVHCRGGLLHGAAHTYATLYIYRTEEGAECCQHEGNTAFLVLVVDKSSYTYREGTGPFTPAADIQTHILSACLHDWYRLAPAVSRAQERIRHFTIAADQTT